ncbi:L-sorbose 1-dehydrogenase [Cyphellophora attinorum]|uniref:L-sorbose 1-dehydrogenase n=1 Tax=Cyphellophora attinorum TaxID=1664694 RepID=A0A0N1H724_9EURO|nr:L-sorbose 1-dehydrogenase [Phialophora attinorum]KPI38305.1 L-sorbose 1-dehydrogenase [Phialophora attinorum]
MSPGRLIQQDEYDFIICGGGTSGCVVAGRLAEYFSDARILLIEAGAHNKDLENVHMVGGWSKNFDTENDWNLVSKPMKGVDGRQVKLSRGRFLGGSSGVNGTLVVKGTKQDYDDWDLPGWSGDEMFEYMRRAEKFNDKDWFHPDPKTPHGSKGYLNTEPHDLAPISKLMLQSMESQGLPMIPDLCSNGNCAHGCGHAARTHHKGVRSTGADFVTNKNHRENIEILTDATVDKINFDTTDGSKPRAVSVSLAVAGSNKRTVHASKEIIISGGAYCTPAVLMRSGIGPRFELLNHNIPLLVDSPGVGQNLLDHLITFAFYEVNQSNLTNDHLVYHSPEAALNAYELYKSTKTGVLSTFPFGAFGFARLDDRLASSQLWQAATRRAPAGRDAMALTPSQPHIEFFTTELYGGPKQYVDFPINQQHAFAMITELFSPRSKGTVTLASADPAENPIIDHNYLADPLDLLVMTEGLQLGNEIVTRGSGTRDLIKGSWPPSSKHHTYTERSQWEDYARQHATTCYHAAGTAKMGKDGDPMAVLDHT